MFKSDSTIQNALVFLVCAGAWLSCGALPHLLKNPTTDLRKPPTRSKQSTLSAEATMTGIVVTDLAPITIYGSADVPPVTISAQQAQGVASLTPHEDLGLLLAQITASEEGLTDNQTGMQAIWQVANNLRPRYGSHLNALRRLSPRIARVRHTSRHRTHWLRELDRTLVQPPSWRECTGTSEGHPCDGVWENHIGQWRETLRLADQTVQSPPVGVCRGRAYAWGCRTTTDQCDDTSFMEARNARRISRGLEPFVALECDSGVKNMIWGHQ